MFCRYCGKQTDNQDGVCDECRASANAQCNGAPYYPAPPYPLQGYGAPYYPVPPYPPQGYGAPYPAPPYPPQGYEASQYAAPPYPPQGYEAPQYAAPPYQPQGDGNAVYNKYGSNVFGIALASTLIGSICNVLSFFGMIEFIAYYAYFMSYGSEITDYLSYDKIGIILSVIGLIGSVTALVLGIVALRKVSALRKKGINAKAPFALGVVGVVTSATALLMLFCGFICYIASFFY